MREQINSFSILLRIDLFFIQHLEYPDHQQDGSSVTTSSSEFENIHAGQTNHTQDAMLNEEKKLLEQLQNTSIKPQTRYNGNSAGFMVPVAPSPISTRYQRDDDDIDGGKRNIKLSADSGLGSTDLCEDQLASWKNGRSPCIHSFQPNVPFLTKGFLSFLEDIEKEHQAEMG